YCNTCWWSDRWDPLSYGQDWNPKKSFFEQFLALQQRTPQLAIQNDNGVGSENSEYCYDISRAKNCYRLVGSWYAEECYYSLNVNRSKYVVDCHTVSISSELVYESLDSQHLYHCTYLQNCQNCRDCFFGYDLKGCSDCFCCFGLRQKHFHIFNTAYSQEEYLKRMTEFNLGSYSAVMNMQKQFDSWVLKFPHLYANIQNCEGCSGNNLFHCKNVLGYSVFNSEYSKFIDRCDGPKNCYDLINTGDPQWCYDCVTPDNSYLALFSTWCWKSRNIILSDNCHSSENLLGCISVHRKKYCILNKPYSKEEYEKSAAQIIDSLNKEQEWGEHLPVYLSPFAYNESAAHEYYPRDRVAVNDRKWRWSDELPYTKNLETVAWGNIPDSIQSLDRKIVAEVFACIDCGRNYKLIPGEVDFYKKIPTPLPRRCPQCRHLLRFRRKNPTSIWQRTCANCAKEIQTTYAPERLEIIYCEDCYLKTV